MKDSEIFDNLCVYDPLNPYYQEMMDIGMYDEGETPEPRDNCFCDNCFYGRDKLAVELLKYIKEAIYVWNILYGIFKNW